VQGVGCGVKGARGFRVQGSGFRGFRIQGLRCRGQRVQGLGSMGDRTNPERLHLDVALSNPPP
jgi:hypothetical protein